MILLSVQSAPLGLASSADRIGASHAWFDDRRAQATAMTERGHRLIVAAPLVSMKPQEQELAPDSLGFEFVALPAEEDLADLPRAMRRLKRALPPIVQAADVVEVADDGRKLSAARRAFALATAAGTPSIVVAGPADPVAKLEAALARTRNPVRRIALSAAIKRLRRFLTSASTTADLVLSPDVAAAVSATSSQPDGRRRKVFLSTAASVTDADLIDERTFNDVLTAAANKRRPLRVRQIRTGHVADAGVVDAVDHARRLSVPLDFVAGDAASIVAADAVDLVIASIDDDRLNTLRARGIPVIAYSPMLLHAQDAYVPRGQVERLAQLLVDLHVDRQRLGILMRGAIEQTRHRTREAEHRRRVAAVELLLESRSTIAPAAAHG